MYPRALPFVITAFCVVILLAVNFKRPQRSDVFGETNPREVGQKEDTDKPLQFFLFHKEIRTQEGQENPSYEVGYKGEALSRAKDYARARRSQGRTKSNGVIEWTERGPGNVPGRTRTLFNIPESSNNTWLAGAATGGIWKTSDGGASWQSKNDNLTVLPIASLAGTTNASVIYAGTGELVSSFYSALGDGIFKSTDKGETWTHLESTKANPDFAVVTRLIVHPIDPNLILATTAPSNTSVGSNNSAIMRTTNGGSSWSKVREITGVFDQIIFTPGNFQVQYASQNSVGVWKSTNGGVTWNLSNTGMSPSGRIEIAVSPVNPNVVFASAEGSLSGVESDLYISKDAGITWSLVDIKFNNAVVDFLGNSPDEDDSQGFYDNTILCDPFDERIVYFGGISLFRTTISNNSSATPIYDIETIGANFLSLINFSATAAQGRLDVGPQANEIDVEIRFGPGRTQKAHRFLVPEGATSGVDDSDYTYAGLVDVPFQAWDITNNRQLIVSFRDQSGDGVFDLIEAATSGPAASQSREYIYIHANDYSPAANPSISVNGGHLFNMMYNIWPVLSPGGNWPPAVNGTVRITSTSRSKFDATTITVADGYGYFDSKNIMNQQDLLSGVHVDQHYMIPIITNEANKTYKILLGNDGGVFVSNASQTPGTTNGSWQFKGFGLNTAQFYGADKRPGSDRYIGGMQDNGTRISPANQSASATSNYSYAIGGDGFEVIWNSVDESRILGSIYFGSIFRSINGGATWQDGTSGLGNGISFPFVTKISNNKDFPNRVFSVSGNGVHVSNDFASSWALTAIPTDFVRTSLSSLDVEVSRANANIVWAGGGMSNLAGQQRKLFVSTDGGKNFTATNNFNAVPMGSITKLASHPSEPNTAYALFSFANAPKILRTQNLGQTWQDISGFNTGSVSTNGFPNVAVYSLYVRPDNPSIVWAGTEIGIFESQDDGLSWSLLEDFPPVAVWDMKGQDNQVVIATHGRGIWTATIDQPQSGYAINPQVIASGTTPGGRLAIRITSAKNFDSLDVLVDGMKLRTVYAVGPGPFDVALPGIAFGNRNVQLISYDGDVPYLSKFFQVEHLNILPVRDAYSTYFGQVSDLLVNNLTLQGFVNLPVGSRMSLQTPHPYSVNSLYSVMPRTPVKISDTFSKMFYADIAILEPDGDSIVVEATKNGLDWIPLAPAYDASKNPLWESAFSSSQTVISNLLEQSEIEITDTFNSGDTLLFRWRVISGPSHTAWGWAIDFISIQEVPVSVEEVYTNQIFVYPNPSPGLLNVRYQLKTSSEVTFSVVDLFGRTILNKSLGMRSTGEHTDALEIDAVSGTYLLRITAGAKSTVNTFVITR